MRDRSSWYKNLAKALRTAWPTSTGRRRPGRLCVIELVLYLLEQLAPGEPARAGWALLGGYPFALHRRDTPALRRVLRIARHHLWALRRPRVWERALEQYNTFPEELRGYRVDDPSLPPLRVASPVAEDRWDTYGKVLASEPSFHVRDALHLAEPGHSYRFVQGKLHTSVSLPGHLPVLPSGRHNLVTPARKQEITVSRTELTETARWMDSHLKITDPRKSWARRVQRLEFDVLDDVGHSFVADRPLTIDGLLHLVGMVGAGKSTLRDVLSVCLARQKRKVTIVVGDVAEQLSIISLLNALPGIRAAPVLGASTRVRNTQRMHRRLASRGSGTLLTHKAEDFTYLSTACPLDALRTAESVTPLHPSEAPCTTLVPVSSHLGEGRDDGPADAEEDPAKPQQAQGCPLWGGCPRHHGAHKLVDADIWVVNPASMVYGLVPRHQNRERARFLELATLRSDLIIVDEADRVQMQLDTMFVPSATLVGRAPDSWLDSLQTHTSQELARLGRRQLSDIDVARWSSSLTLVIAATNRIYSMLMRHEKLSSWVQADYFSTWTVQQKLVDDWFRDKETQPADADEEPDIDAEDDDDPEDDPDEAGEPDFVAREREDERSRRYDTVVNLLDTFRDDPLGDRRPTDPELTDLIQLTQDLLHTLDEAETHRHAQKMLTRLAWRKSTGDDELAVRTLRLEFMLLLGVLQHRLDVLTDLWPLVEARLNLEATDNQMSRRPPADYSPLVPESPMGNILGFQFLIEEDTGGGVPEARSPVLRYFRCAGVGRSLLLDLHTMAGPGDTPPPHVMLMSGTSWAGTAAGAHVIAPVGAILKAPRKEQLAIRRTTFHKLFLKGPDGKPLHLSGVRPDRRAKVLELMLDRLAHPTDGRLFSALETELEAIRNPDRERLLLLVGSYEEARVGAEFLNALPKWRGKVCRLIADDVELEVSYGGAAPDSPSTPADDEPMTLRRGDVATFAETGAKILFAPLLSVERGHNILNSVSQAAIGSVFFLARPHPRPHDINLAVQGINSWVTRYVRSNRFYAAAAEADDLDAAGRTFRRDARVRWRHLLTRRMAWRSLNDTDKAAFTWDRIVVMWQVIGRLVRGGVPARVVFVDSQFAPLEAAGRGPDTYRSGLLASMLHVLRPYMTDDESIPLRDRQLVSALYKPLYEALEALQPYRPDSDHRAA
ncbi:signal recognition particle [Streptomyces microflavus]|uniref:pPIWI_RE_Z domain-containing protein n=1 Tax=Streptomyces microflavus TaxID=1919 RepID=UPI0033F44EE0